MRHNLTISAVIWVLATALVAACASHRSASPYTAGADTPRDSRKADQLNARAASMMDSDPQGAEALLREALASDLFHGPAHNNLGVILLRQGELYQAAREFEWAAKVMVGHPDPKLNLALTLETAGRTDDALVEYRKALEVRPGHIPSTQALARLEVSSGRRTEETAQRLRTISLEGESAEWREWAMLELAKRSREGVP